MKSETVPIDTLTLDPRNTRVHDERNLSTIAASLKRFGQVKPIVVDADGLIVAGNGTVEAAKSLGWSEIIAVRTGLKGVEAAAYSIADNRTAEIATWDEPALVIVLKELREDITIDETCTGFSVEEIDEYLMPTEIVEDEVPEPPDDPITKPGDLWIMCEHRVLCGDSTKAEDVGLVMDGGRAALCLTDPPYAIMGSSTGAKNDPALIRPFFRALWKAIAASGAFDVYVCCDWRSYPTVAGEISSYEIKDVVIWDKGCGGLGNPYRRRHEFIVFARPAVSDTKMMGRSVGGCSITDDDVWQFTRERDKQHNAQKPVGLFSRCVENSSLVGDIVFDPFLGSGTTLIAAEQLGRKCFGIEIEGRYCDVIVKRWEKLTGQKATLAK